MKNKLLRTKFFTVAWLVLLCLIMLAENVMSVNANAFSENESPIQELFIDFTGEEQIEIQNENDMPETTRYSHTNFVGTEFKALHPNQVLNLEWETPTQCLWLKTIDRKTKAALYLPLLHGTRIKSLGFMLDDNNPDVNLVFYLMRDRYDGGASEAVKTFTYIGEGSLGRDFFVDIVVDNYLYGYYVVVEFPELSTKIQFCGFTLGVEKTVFKPSTVYSMNEPPSHNQNTEHIKEIQNHILGDKGLELPLGTKDMPFNILWQPGSMFLPLRPVQRQTVDYAELGCVGINIDFHADQVELVKPVILPEDTRLMVLGARFADMSRTANIDLKLYRQSKWSKKKEVVGAIELSEDYFKSDGFEGVWLDSDPGNYGHRLDSRNYAYYFSAKFANDHQNTWLCNMFLLFQTPMKYYVAFPVTRQEK